MPIFLFFIRPFVHCAICLPWQRRYGKHLQRRRTNAAAEAARGL